MSTTSSARSSDQPRTIATRWARWMRGNTGLFAFVLILIAVACVPLYGILFPPSADLSLHILISKLLWEKLTGVSHLDIEISWYFGYRFWAYLIVLLIAFCKLFGISLLSVPKLVAFAVISIHAAVIGCVFYPYLRDEEWKTWLRGFAFALPAAICVYSAAWFTGFAGYTLAVSFLVAAVWFSERYLRGGRALDALLVLVSLVALYGCHPFTMAFWLLWGGCRSIASVPAWTIRSEWKRILILGLLTLPVLIYHFVATMHTEVLAPDTSGLSSPLVSTADWYEKRFLAFFRGDLLRVDYIVDARPFALLAIALIVVAAVVVFLRSEMRDARPAAIAGIIFLALGSWINEDFIPVPKGHWLAYDLRFASAAYAVCLSIAGVLLLRSSRVSGRYRVFANFLGVLIAVISAYQLFEISDAYRRFDHPARVYVDRMLRHERPARDDQLPESPWYHQDARLFLRRYRCLREPDCNPAGTPFNTIGGDVYPIRIRSPKRTLPPNVDLAELYGPPGNAFAGGCGFAGGEFARPRGLAVDAVGNIYVADTGNIRIQKFDPDGDFIFSFGIYGTGVGEFTEPTGVAVDDAGAIYVTDPPGQKLMRFHADGSFEREWKGKALGFNRPMDIAIAPNSVLYLTDLDEHAIIKFYPATESATHFGSAGKGNGTFNRLAGLGIGGDHIFVADVDNDLIQVFDLNGNFVRQWEVKVWNKWLFHYPDAAYDERTDIVYVTNGGWSSDIVAYRSDGKLLYQSNVAEDSALINPSSLVISNTGGPRRLLILNTGSDAKDLGDPRVSSLRLGG